MWICGLLQPELSYFRQARSNNPGYSLKPIVIGSHGLSDAFHTDLRVRNASPPPSAQPPTRSTRGTAASLELVAYKNAWGEDWGYF